MVEGADGEGVPWECRERRNTQLPPAEASASLHPGNTILDTTTLRFYSRWKHGRRWEGRERKGGEKESSKNAACQQTPVTALRVLTPDALQGEVQAKAIWRDTGGLSLSLSTSRAGAEPNNGFRSKEQGATL